MCGIWCFKTFIGIGFWLVMCKMQFESGSDRVPSEFTQKNWVLRNYFGNYVQPSFKHWNSAFSNQSRERPQHQRLLKSCIWYVFVYRASPLGIIRFFFVVPSQNKRQIQCIPNLSTRIRIRVLSFGFGLWHSNFVFESHPSVSINFSWSHVIYITWWERELYGLRTWYDGFLVLGALERKKLNKIHWQLSATFWEGITE